ncbi:hypothetical protein AYJ57_24580 (plasmid) [Salipiger sp. CCB-MM3]|uniref:ABC transporter substrate-binding protein n=1 Tax=Salipiger sp. CCB-MM3 TaxID=1792508 RepID=UPI00080AA83C|nr:ABC transporter substrate-binding protein [Salipiger sp. CCB-MM3]ANT63655.1 hypothetical protein AYJ57_24580 [Salipiger sp. CCB-MM3]
MSQPTSTRKTKIRRAARCAAVALATTVTGSAAMAQDALSLRLNWTMKGEFTPFVVAASKGFFAEQDLDVTVKEGSGATLALQSVATGQDDFAYVPSVQVIQAINGGMPIQAIATVSKVDSMGMVARPGVTLATPADLQGKKVEIAASSTFNNIWDAFAAKNEIDKDAVEVVAVNPGARFGLLLSGQVDVLADIFITNELPVLEAKAGESLDHIAVGDFGFPIIGYTLVARSEMIESQPEVVRRFLDAAKEGFEFVSANPADAAEIAVAAYPEQLMPEATIGQVEALNAFLAEGSPSALFVGSDEGWQATLETLKDTGVIDAFEAPGSYYTNAFVTND